MQKLFSLLSSNILKRGSWSNKTTWKRFYNRSIMSFEEKLQKAVLNYRGFEERRMGVWTPLLHCHDVGWIEHLGPYISLHTEEGNGILKLVTCLQILLFLNYRSVVHFCRWSWWWGLGRVGGSKNRSIFCGRHEWRTPLIEKEILWNKIQKLHKATKQLQCNLDFMNKIERSNVVHPPTLIISFMINM